MFPTHRQYGKRRGAEVYQLAPRLDVPGLARNSQVDAEVSFDSNPYLDQFNSATPSLHDLDLCRSLFANEHNFSPQTRCDLFELHVDGTGRWQYSLEDAKMVDYIHGTKMGQSKSSPPATVFRGPAIGSLIKMRAIFVTMSRQEKTSFGYQLSMGHQTLQMLLKTFRVTPHFCPSMLGDADYWAPLDIQRRNLQGVTDGIEFVCQQPRFAARNIKPMCSTYMGFDLETHSATYIIVSAQQDSVLGRVKSRLNSYFPAMGTSGFAALHADDPFLLLSIICHETLVESKAIITQIRRRLCDQLDFVDMYADSPFDRSNLKELTNKLYKISQETNSLLAITDKEKMVVEHVIRARDRALRLFPLTFSDVTVGDSLSYIKHSLESQNRWLMSYRSQKDIAMNLVFNLVTQQDSVTNTAIARDTKDDSASMKIIALLTMLFLPATAVSSFFGMAFFFPGPNGDLEVSRTWWLFVAITLPLTLLILLLWWLWYPATRVLMDWSESTFFHRTRKALIQHQEDGDGLVEKATGILGSSGGS